MDYVIVQDSEVQIKKVWVDIVKMLSHGRKVGEIATELNINRRTLEFEISKIKDVMRCSTIGQLTAAFVREKLID